MTTSLYQSSIASLPLLGRGKVRDNYAVGDDKILIVTSDRLSAFDVVHAGTDPGQGQGAEPDVAISGSTSSRDIVPNHLTGIAPESVVAPEEADAGARPRGGGQEAQAASWSKRWCAAT